MVLQVVVHQIDVQDHTQILHEKSLIVFKSRLANWKLVILKVHPLIMIFLLFLKFPSISMDKDKRSFAYPTTI